jgi:hypothetical protein
VKRIALLGGLLLLVGCPSKTVTVVCKWTGNGNSSVPVCGTAPCLSNYSLYRQDTGAVIATIPITSTTYSFSASTVGLTGSVTLGLQVNRLNADGTTTASPRALSVAVIP